jgi:hypothetical protein
MHVERGSYRKLPLSMAGEAAAIACYCPADLSSNGKKL